MPPHPAEVLNGWSTIDRAPRDTLRANEFANDQAHMLLIVAARCALRDLGTSFLLGSPPVQPRMCISWCWPWGS
jgi:hypothetical protein